MSNAEKTRRQRQRKALAPGNKGHQQRREETKPLNDTPNDGIRRDETAKVKACQRCHHKYAKQFSVVLSEKGEREIVSAQAGASHYCKDCAKERRDELQRFDARPKKSKTEAKAKRASARKRGDTKRKPAKKRTRLADSAPAKAKAAAKKAREAAKAASTEVEPF